MGTWDGSIDQRFYPVGTANLQDGALIGFTSEGTNTTTGSEGNITISDSSGTIAGGDYLALGTWTNGIWSDGGYSKLVPAAGFVIGQPTPVPQSGFASLFTQVATYNMTAATPVYSTGSGPGVVNSGQITVNFQSTQPINVQINVTMPPVGSASFPSTYSLTGSGAPNGSWFTVQLIVNGGGCAATASCGSGTGSGFFVGPNAQRIGLGFSGDTGIGGHGTIGGAIVLRDPNR